MRMVGFIWKDCGMKEIEERLLFALVLPLLTPAFANADESAAEKSMDDLAVICIEAKIGPFSYESVSISNAFEAIIKAANQECSKKGYGIRLNYILSGSEEWEKRERKLQIGCVPILEACEKAGKVFRADVFYSQGSIAVSEKKITDEQLVAFDRDFQNVLKSLFVESISFKGGSSVDLIRKVCQESNKLLEKEGHGTIGLMLQVNDDDRISPMVIPSNTIYDAFNFAANRIGARLEYERGNFRVAQTNTIEETANLHCHYRVVDDKCQDEKMCCSPDKNHNTITEQTSKDDLCRYLNSTCIGPYDFSDKGYSEIVATMLADARQNLTASGSEYSIGLSGGVDVTQEGRVVKIQVPKLPILDAFCLVAGHFNAVATYQIGCIWIRPNANAKR